MLTNYNHAGQLTQVAGQGGTKVYASGMQYNALGQLTSVLLGNGVQTTNAYYSLSGRLLSSVSADIPAEPVLSMGYTYDPVGNITRITDTTRSEVNNYTYDSLDRLTWITATTGANLIYQQVYAYAPTGNILSVGRWPLLPTHTGAAAVGGSSGLAGNHRGGVTGFVGGTAHRYFTHGGGPVVIPPGDPVWSYADYDYDDPAHVHAVTSASGLGTFDYDDNGNMTERFEGGTTYTQTFDVENRLVSVAVSGGGTTQYQYDANGQMIKKIAPNGTVTVYLGLVEYEIVGGVTTTTSYYTVPGARVVRVNSTLSYVLTDHLGSSSVPLDAGGSVDGEMRYYAYGETRISTGSTPTERLYTGQLRQDELGLDYYNARWYYPYLNQWIQPDSIVAGSGALTVNPLDSLSAQAFYSGDRGAPPRSPQELNRYSYALNSPTNHTDPSGHVVPCPRCGFANWIWTAVTSLLGLPSSVDISGRGTVNAVAVQLSCGVVGGICKVEDGIMQATTNGEMMEQGVVAFGATVISNPLSGISCPNCGQADPLLLRSRGAIATRQHVTDLAQVGQDGISAWCSGCTTPSGKFWGRTSSEIRNFAASLGLDPDKALVYTPQFGGEGHYSLFIDAIGTNGYLLDDYANAIDEFLRAGVGSTNP